MFFTIMHAYMYLLRRCYGTWLILSKVWLLLDSNDVYHGCITSIIYKIFLGNLAPTPSSDIIFKCGRLSSYRWKAMNVACFAQLILCSLGQKLTISSLKTISGDVLPR